MKKTKNGIFYSKTKDNASDAILKCSDLIDKSLLCTITCMDSTRSPNEINGQLIKSNIITDIVNGLCVSRFGQVVKAVKENIFTGFDEIWITNYYIVCSNFNDDFSITSDDSDFSEFLPVTFEKKMLEIGCILSVGDGCGLNFATINEDIANRINL